MDEGVGGVAGLDLLALDVVDDLAFQAGHDDVRIDGVLLAEPVAAADRLVVRLIRIGQAEEHHLVALLEVHSEPGDRRLRDEDPDYAVLERFERLSLVVGRP